MPAIIAGSEVIFEFPAELFGDGGVFEEDGVVAIAGGEGERGGCYVFGHPGGVAETAVEGGDEGVAGCDVRYGAWKPILEEAGWIDRRGNLFA